MFSTERWERKKRVWVFVPGKAPGESEEGLVRRGKKRKSFLGLGKKKNIIVLMTMGKGNVSEDEVFRRRKRKEKTSRAPIVVSGRKSP